MQEEIAFAMRSICSRLETAPDSADTVSGVHTFWIEWPEPAPWQGITLEALQKLEVEGLTERTIIGAKEVWRKAKRSHPSLLFTA